MGGGAARQGVHGAARAMNGTTLETWLARNALQLLVALLVAVFGWSVNATLGGIADDIAANTARLERLGEGLNGVLVDQASHARRIEHLERRLDHVETQIERSR